MEEIKTIVIDPKYAVRNSLIRVPGIPKHMAERVLNIWGLKLREKLLRGDSYSIINEENSRNERKIIFVSIKQRPPHHILYKQRMEKYDHRQICKVTAEDIMHPNLILSIDTNESGVRRRNVGILRAACMKDILRKMPYADRYKFPKK